MPGGYVSLIGTAPGNAFAGNAYPPNGGNVGTLDYAVSTASNGPGMWVGTVQDGLTPPQEYFYTTGANWYTAYPQQGMGQGCWDGKEQTAYVPNVAGAGLASLYGFALPLPMTGTEYAPEDLTDAPYGGAFGYTSMDCNGLALAIVASEGSNPIPNQAYFARPGTLGGTVPGVSIEGALYVVFAEGVNTGYAYVSAPGSPGTLTQLTY
jgi:hypothetical protein